MNQADLQFLGEIVRARSGLVLTAEKGYLLESRLAPVARREKFDSLEDLVGSLRRSRDERLAWAVTEAMTTNETFFFRDKTPFDTFRNHVLPAALKEKNDTLRIWCAAASTGQEPYSLAMILAEESAKLGGRKVEIVGTDICTKALDKAKAGIYSQFEVQRGLPVQMLVKHFTKDGESWLLSPEIRQAITFRRFNLLEDYRSLGRFDVIFCRNVLIYFDAPTKKQILDRMAGLLNDPGFIVLGAAETVMGITDTLQSVSGQRGLYQRPESAAANAA